MQYFMIAIKDIKNFIDEKKLVFSILMFSIIISMYAFCFFTALNMHSINLVNNYNSVTNRYFISNDSKQLDTLKVNTIIEWINQNQPEIRYNVYSEISLNEQYNEKVIMNNSIQNYQSIKSNEGTSLKNENLIHYNLIIGSNYIVSNRVDFIGDKLQQKDLDEKSRYILIEPNNEFLKENLFGLNKNYDVNGKNYIVKAIDFIDFNNLEEILFQTNHKKYDINYNGVSTGIIPYTTFENDKYEIYALEIFLPNNITNEVKNDFKELLNQNMNTFNISYPKRNQNAMLSDMSFYTIIYSIFMILALINIVALFKYWIEKNWRKYMIYRLCGASSKKIYLILIIEILIIALISTFLGAILYYLSTPLLNLINIKYILNYFEIFSVQVLILLLVFITTQGAINKLSRTSPRYMERG